MDFRRSLVRLTFNSLKNLFLFFRYVAPWLLEVAWRTASVMWRITLSISGGMRTQIDQIAANIMNDAANYLPIGFHSVLRWFSYVVAYLTVILGYILLSHVTVWIWRWLWSFL